MSAPGPKDLQDSSATTSSPTTRPPAVAIAAATDKSLVCQWDKCSERCVSAEALFNHICEKHVGRKSTNNLNLTCGWASCRTTTVKRDHITSHIRVHVPLKPHGCDFCGKAFKRPQDLKKHVKTHTDDSVVLRSSEVNQNGINKAIDVLHYRGSQSAYYKQSLAMPGNHGQYANAHNSVHNSYFTQQPNPYGSVYYPSTNGTDSGHNSSYDNRKRSFDTLNDFFGDAKRRQIDPNSYSQVGQRLLALHGLPIHHTGLSDYMSTGSSLVSVENQNGGNQLSVSTHQYALPLPNLRTKTDLMNVDQFLEQMQSTVYESSNAAAAAGVHQPGAHYTHAGINFRQSHSPPQTNTHNLNHLKSNIPSHSANLIPEHQQTIRSNAPNNTPTLTPSSSTMSYTSSHSPVSPNGLSPTVRNSNITSVAYPSLPAMSMGYQSHSSNTAPTSSLGPIFDNEVRRRYSGGMLQRSSNPLRRNGELISMDESPIESQNGKVNLNHSVNQNIDPALSEVNSHAEPLDNSESARDKAEEAWIKNIRVIEALRNLVNERLRRKEYESDDDDVSMTGICSKQLKEENFSRISYPTLRTDDH
ncbi:putative zinc finger protein pac1 [Erysiphe necator]|uniref:Putative zinc finger protein pac1 n=1 Tax=Uncinula necator TaxID=52586 RepID=A0A0B1NYB5_UNCNE|nr:putative zinc finger protein pac1 [Erysiphe necator]